MSVSDLWRGMAPRKSHVCELKKLDAYAFKKQTKKASVGVELRAGGDPHRPETPGWSAGDMRQWPKQKKMHTYPASFPADHFKIYNKNDNPKRLILFSA